MVKNVGAYKQGSIIKQAADEVHESGLPHRAAPAGAVPAGDDAGYEPIKTVGSNDAKKAH
jgi:hypothetical protein